MQDPATDVARLVEALALYEAFCAGTSEHEDDAALVAAHPRLADLLQPMLDGRDPAMTIGQPQAAPGRHSLAAGDRLGPYIVQREIGDGGMGSVFLVEQTEPIRRQAALKYIKLGMDTAEVIARFELERQTLALMDHACIAKVFDAGTSPQGRPYFVMEYVEGEGLLAWCDRRQLPLRARLELFARICDAVQHAHQKGVIHRDLKPSNILVTEQDGQPIPKIIDFGIAKAVEGQAEPDSQLTRVDQVIGTPGYMSPEQAQSGGAEADTRTDVYSLGVVLFELLVDDLPFVAKDHGRAALHALLREICEREPPRPSQRIQPGSAASRECARLRGCEPDALRAVLRGELDWIALKALAKDPDHRYPSAAELASDVRRYLAHEPIEARPPSTTYRLRKFVRRHRVPVTAALVVLTAIVVALPFSIAMYLQAERERRTAEKNQASAEAVSDYLIDLFRQAAPAQSMGEGVKVQDLLLPGAKALDERVPDPFIRARLASALGQVLASLGEFTDATRLLRESLTDAGARDIVLRRESRESLAGAYRQTGSFLEAHDLYAELAEAGSGERDRARLAMYRADQAYCARRLGREQDARRLLTIAEGALSDAAGDSPLLARAHRAVASVRFELEDWDDALRHYRTARTEWARLYPRGHPWLAQVDLSIGACLNRMRRTDEAQKAVEASVREVARFYGADHHFTAYPLQAHAELLRRQGERVKAVGFYQECIARLATSPEPNRAFTGRVMSNLGLIQWELGRFTEAEKTLRGALRIFAAANPEDHPDTAATQTVLAQVLIDRLQLDEAETLVERAISTWRKLDSRRLAPTLGCKANLLLKRQQLDAAEKTNEEALGLLLPDQEEERADFLLRAALIQDLRNRPEPALRAVAAAREILRRLHIDTDVRIGNLHYLEGWAHQTAGRAAAADESLRASITAFEAAAPDGHVLEAYPRDLLGSALFGRHEYDEALPHLQRAYDLRCRFLPESAHFRLTSANNLAALRYERGEYDKAAPLIDAAIRLRRAHYRAPDMDLATALHWGSRIALARGEVGRANERATQAREMYAQLLPQGHWILSMVDSVRGEIRAAQGRPDEARALFEAALPQLRKGSPARRSALEKLVAVLTGLGDDAAAARYRAELDR